MKCKIISFKETQNKTSFEKVNSQIAFNKRITKFQSIDLSDSNVQSFTLNDVENFSNTFLSPHTSIDDCRKAKIIIINNLKHPTILLIVSKISSNYKYPETDNQSSDKAIIILNILYKYTVLSFSETNKSHEQKDKNLLITTNNMTKKMSENIDKNNKKLSQMFTLTLNLQEAILKSKNSEVAVVKENPIFTLSNNEGKNTTIFLATLKIINNMQRIIENALNFEDKKEKLNSSAIFQ